jgi:hypothetical protein
MAVALQTIWRRRIQETAALLYGGANGSRANGSYARMMRGSINQSNELNRRLNAKKLLNIRRGDALYGIECVA